MEYKKDPLRYGEQADLLISRGLLADRNNLIESLKNVNYYRLSGYLYPYRDNNGGSDVFIQDTSFEDVWRHYTFDRRLRFLLMDAVERVEVSLRSRLVYYFVHKHGPFGYLSLNNFPNLEEEYFIKFIDSLKIEINRSKEFFLVHYNEKYGDDHEMPPLWMVCELFNFGALLTFLRGVDKETKRKLAFDVKIPDILLFSWLRSLGHIRNICAHHGRVWNKDYRVLLPKK